VVKSGFGVAVGDAVTRHGRAAPGSISVREFQLTRGGSSAPESGVTLALWFSRLATGLSFEGATFSPFRREAPGEALNAATCRALLCIGEDADLSFDDGSAFLAAHGEAFGGESEARALEAAMRAHLTDLCAVQVTTDGGRPPRLFVGGRASDGSIVGLVALP
jgi:hypothetical protein